MEGKFWLINWSVTLGELPIDTSEETVEDFSKILRPNELSASVESMLSLAAQHRSVNESAYERAPRWTSRSGIELGPTGPGALFARWTFEPGPEHLSQGDSRETRTVEFVLGGGQQGTGTYLDPLLEYLRGLPKDPHDLRRWPTLWLGDAYNPQRIRIALAEEPRNASDAEKLISDLHAIGLRCAALLSPGPSAVEHGEFLYDETGLPK